MTPEEALVFLSGYYGHDEEPPAKDRDEAWQTLKTAVFGTSHNKQIMPVCPHAKIKWVVYDCGIKSELAYDFLDCNGDGTYSVPGNNGFGYSRLCGKVAPGKPA